MPAQQNRIKVKPETAAPVLIGAEHTADLTRQVHHVRELLDLHKRVDDDRLGLAHPVDVVPGEVDQHDVFGAVLDRRGELSREFGVLCAHGLVSLHQLQSGEDLV
jgi:hypothetical protein